MTDRNTPAETITAHAAINDGRIFSGVRTPNATAWHPRWMPYEMTESELAAQGWGSDAGELCPCETEYERT